MEQEVCRKYFHLQDLVPWSRASAWCHIPLGYSRSHWVLKVGMNLLEPSVVPEYDKNVLTTAKVHGHLFVLLP